MLLLAGDPVPDLDRAVPTRAGYRATARMECHSKDEMGVSVKREQVPALGQVPYFDGLVITCRGQKAAIGTDGQPADASLVAAESVNHVPGLAIPDRDDGAITTSGQEIAVRTPGQAGKAVVGPRQLADLAPGPRVPKPDTAVLAGAGQATAVGAKRHTPNKVSVPAQGKKRRVGRGGRRQVGQPFQQNGALGILHDQS